jgi:hypothetical protein
MDQDTSSRTDADRGGNTKLQQSGIPPPFGSWYPACVFLMILFSLPARLATLSSSVWLDEAWVANSVRAGSVREMLFYSTWQQNTPALFLVIERAVSQIAGDSEIALRIFPFIAGLGALAFTAWALRALFLPAASLLGLSLVICNYYAVKYPQQIKQYGADLLVTALIVYLVVIYWTRTFPPRVFWPLSLAGAFGSLLAFPALFLVPSVVISLGAGAMRRRSSRVGAAVALLLIVACQSANYLFFIRPNQSAELFASRSAEFLNIHTPLSSAYSLVLAYSALLVPGSAAAFGSIAAGAILAIAAFGGVRCLLLTRRRSVTGIVTALTALMPLGSVVAASLLGQYPVLEYPRLILWSLPCIALLAACAADPLVVLSQKYPRMASTIGVAVTLTCFLAVAALDFTVLRYPRGRERNAEAVAFLRSNMSPGDYLYLHGGMWEQFQYYARRTSWAPRNVYVGAMDWPCCALNVTDRVSSPGVADFGADLMRAAALSEGRRLWFLVPSGLQGHWSFDAQTHAHIASIPSVIQSKGCLSETRESFDQTLVMGFRCP